ncbi:MAG: MarR family transcriptional regulator [Mycobacteriaceae bacterium]|nr:MarR family transcriptional regulator [Mycobacteriaceae bacterium]
MTKDVAAFVQATKAVSREMERRLNDAMRPLGVTGPQAEAIVIIGAHEPMALKELGTRLIAEAGHPSRLVDRLVDGGHVRRRVPDDNRRKVELTLTARGRALVPRILQARATIMEWSAQVLGDCDLPAALSALHAILGGDPPASALGMS